MSLPVWVEFLLTVRRPGGGSLVHQGASQIVLKLVPPGLELTYSTFPLGSDFCDLVYRLQIDPTVVPGAFYSWGAYHGSRISGGIVTADLIGSPLDSFVFISHSEPAQAYLRNQSRLAQNWSASTFYLAIANEDDFLLVQSSLSEIGWGKAIANENNLRK